MVCQTKKSGIEKLDNLVSVCFFINLISVYNMKCKFPPACIFVCCINVSTKIELERNVTFMSGYITFEERLEIESMIFQRCSFGEIAKKINKDRSTISREIRRHSVIEKSGYSGFGFNACVYKETCKMGMVCGDKCVKTSCKLCRTCGHCNDYCPKFAEQVCILRIKPPYVCNGCDERNKCTLEKTVYSAVQANIMAEQEISSSRKGALCDEAEIARLNAFVTPLILNSQSVHQIYCNNLYCLSME